MLTCPRELHFFMWLYVNIRHLFLSNYRTFFSVPFQGCSTSNGIPQLLFIYFLMWECLNFSFILEGTFTCSVMIAKAVIFITLHYYNAVLLSYSLYCALDLYGLLASYWKFASLKTSFLIPPPPSPSNHHLILYLLWVWHV